MTLLTFAGAGLVAYALIKGVLDQGQYAIRDRLKATIVACGIGIEKDFDFDYVKIHKVKPTPFGYLAELVLPIGLVFSNFKKFAEHFEQATGCAVRMRHLGANRVRMELGAHPLLDIMNYNDEHLVKRQRDGKKSLGVPLYTPFGVHVLDFWDEASTHLLVGGATRMGKSVFVRTLIVHLIRSMKGNVQILYINNKVADAFPFRDVAQITPPAATIDAAIDYLKLALIECETRKEKLAVTKDAVNIKQYRDKHPEDPVPPLFVIIDEYARLSDSEDFQKLVTELGETAGYLDIHLVLATQRPDATTVLKPRIRANLMARLAFQTVDETNSKMIVHTPDAFNLGAVKGRAILLDGLPSPVQVPYMSEEQCFKLLNPYRRNFDAPEYKRQESPSDAETLPSFVKGSTRNYDMS